MKPNFVSLALKQGNHLVHSFTSFSRQHFVQKQLILPKNFSKELYKVVSEGSIVFGQLCDPEIACSGVSNWTSETFLVFAPYQVLF